MCIVEDKMRNFKYKVENMGIESMYCELLH